MAHLRLVQLEGGFVEISSRELDRLRSALNGEVLTPGDAGYDDAREVWNGMIDRRPGLIARCLSAEDVATAVDFARERRLLVSVRGGGHHIAGNAVCEGGLMIDLSAMNDVEVDPGSRTARVGPGATLGDLDRATQAHGLVVPTGINSTTGVAGLTLGGGLGWLSRKLGLTADSLLATDVVTADGARVQASETENPDLFWALRGGGGNFGVVTSFEFRAHELGPEVVCGPIVHPAAAGPEIFDFYRDFVASAPDELAVWLVLRKAPPLPFLPEAVHGTDVVILACCHAGPVDEGLATVRPLLDFGEPLGSCVGPAPFAEFQTAFDPLLTPGLRNYWKSHNFTELSDGLVRTVLEGAATVPTPHSEIFLAQLGGAVNRVPADAMAYPHRDVEFMMNVHTRWGEPADDGRCVLWARELFAATGEHAAGGVYLNFMPEDEDDRVLAAYGDHWRRLSELKQRYDPMNLFRMNPNVRPRELAVE